MFLWPPVVSFQTLARDGLLGRKQTPQHQKIKTIIVLVCFGSSIWERKRIESSTRNLITLPRLFPFKCRALWCCESFRSRRRTLPMRLLPAVITGERHRIAPMRGVRRLHPVVFARMPWHKKVTFTVAQCVERIIIKNMRQIQLGWVGRLPWRLTVSHKLFPIVMEPSWRLPRTEGQCPCYEDRMAKSLLLDKFPQLRHTCLLFLATMIKTETLC